MVQIVMRGQEVVDVAVLLHHPMLFHKMVELREISCFSHGKMSNTTRWLVSNVNSRDHILSQIFFFRVTKQESVQLHLLVFESH